MQICKNKESATVADIVFVKGLDEIEVEHTIQTMKRKGELLRIGGGYRLV
jgi:predicted membrane GTPase involved in stress response